MRVLCGRRLRSQRPSVHILRGAHQRGLPGAQRVRVPGKRARRCQDPVGCLQVRSALLAPVPAASDALAARPRRVLPHARPVPRRRQVTSVRPHLQHGPKYVPTYIMWLYIGIKISEKKPDKPGSVLKICENFVTFIKFLEKMGFWGKN